MRRGLWVVGMFDNLIGVGTAKVGIFQNSTNNTEDICTGL